MHELSIAQALVGLTREHVPSNTLVRSVHVRVGPMQAIESEAMQFAWQATIEGTSFEQASLSLEYVPWELHCRACDRHWQGSDWPQVCECGSSDVDPAGSDELTLLSIEFDEPETTSPANREAGSHIHPGA